MSTSLAARVGKPFDATFGGEPPFSPTIEQAHEPEWDSLKHAQLVVALERTFGVRFNGREIVQMNSIAAIIKVLQGKGVQ